jgi:hypothetical protein
VETARKKETGIIMNEKPKPRNRKHRVNIQRVYDYLVKNGPSTAMKITEGVRTKGGTRPRLFPTTNQLSNLLRRDERFMHINDRQQSLRGHSTITWGLVEKHQDLIDKPEYNTNGGSRDWR